MQGCDPIPMLLYSSHPSFQFTHPYRVRLTYWKAAISRSVFQFTHPHRMRLTASSIGLVSTYFNSRIHTGCDTLTGTRFPDIAISIHASTQDATWLIFLHDPAMFISIHASTQDATGKESYDLTQQKYFNSRIHTGCDLSQKSTLSHPSNIPHLANRKNPLSFQPSNQPGFPYAH